MEKEKNPVISKRLKELSGYRKHVLAASPEEMLDTILDYHQPAALVHSFPAEDFHLLIHDIGLADSLPLLKLASGKQWEYLFDIEVWQKDRLCYHEITGWLERLLAADPVRLSKWCYEEKVDFIELFLFRNIEVRIREDDQSPSDMGNGFFSDDETFYVRLRDYPVSDESEKKIKQKRNQVLTRLLQALSRYDHVRYQGLLLEAAAMIPAETEEALFRLRNVRLSEKGFLPFHEAIGVYQPIKVEEIKARGKKRLADQPDQVFMPPVPSYAKGMLDDDNLFSRSLKSIENTAVVLQLQTEFAGLCNQVISADQITLKSRSHLNAVVGKVSGYLSMGLEELMKGKKKGRRFHGASLIETCFLSDIFRIGYGMVLKLKWEADKWRKESWFQEKGLPLSFWGEAWLGVLGGLLLEKPQYFQNDLSNGLYRDFQTLKEVADAASVLETIKAFDAIFSLMDCSVENFKNNPLFFYKNFLLTLWAGSQPEIKVAEFKKMGPIPLDRFRIFFETLWETGPSSRLIGNTAKEAFLTWLAGVTGLDEYLISRQIGNALESLFEEVEDALADVSVHHLDHRFIHLFLLTDPG